MSSSARSKAKASSSSQISAQASSSTVKSANPERKALKVRYTHVHFCSILWEENDFKGKKSANLENELADLTAWIQGKFDTTIVPVVLKSTGGYGPEEDLIEKLRTFYAEAEDAAAQETDSGKHIAIILYSGHGHQGPIETTTFPAAKYRPHDAGPPGAEEPEDDFAPETYQQLLLHDSMPKITNKEAVENEFVDPKYDFSSTPKGVLDWTYVWASVTRPEKLASWVILQACQSGSATISKLGMRKKKLGRTIKNAKKKETDAGDQETEAAGDGEEAVAKRSKAKADKESAAKERVAAEKELNDVTSESHKRVENVAPPKEDEAASETRKSKPAKAAEKPKKGKGKPDATAVTEEKQRNRSAQGPVHYWTAVGPDINARTGPASFVKVLQSALDATFAKTKAQKRQKGATREFGEQGEFRIKDVWNHLSSVGDAGGDVGDEDIDLFGDDEGTKVRDDQKGFQRMIGVDQEQKKKTLRARREQIDKEPSDAGKAKAKQIVVPNAPADWRLPYYSTIPAGWEDMRLLQSFEAGSRKKG